MKFFADYETSIMLRLMGFDLPCMYFYNQNAIMTNLVSQYGNELTLNTEEKIENLPSLGSPCNDFENWNSLTSVDYLVMRNHLGERTGEPFKICCSAPLWDQVLYWLEMKRVYMSINYVYSNTYSYTVEDSRLEKPNITVFQRENFPTRYNCIENAIHELVTIW